MAILIAKGWLTGTRSSTAPPSQHSMARCPCPILPPPSPRRVPPPCRIRGRLRSSAALRRSGHGRFRPEPTSRRNDRRFGSGALRSFYDHHVVLVAGVPLEVSASQGDFVTHKLVAELER